MCLLHLSTLNFLFEMDSASQNNSNGFGGEAILLVPHKVWLMQESPQTLVANRGGLVEIPT